MLLAAGLSLVEAIETLAQKEKRAEWRAVLASLLAVLRQGQPLSSALEQAPAAFPPLYVATVRAAERTSDLVPALARYVAYQAQLEAHPPARGQRLDLSAAADRRRRRW